MFRQVQAVTTRRSSDQLFKKLLLTEAQANSGVRVE
jgi:hypothetical protein